MSRWKFSTRRLRIPFEPNKYAAEKIRSRPVLSIKSADEVHASADACSTHDEIARLAFGSRVKNKTPA